MRELACENTVNTLLGLGILASYVMLCPIQTFFWHVSSLFQEIKPGFTVGIRQLALLHKKTTPFAHLNHLLFPEIFLPS